MHTKTARAFARSGHLTPEDLDLGQECRDVWLAVTSNKAQRERLTQGPLKHIVYRLRREGERSDPLEQIDRLIVAMAAVGIPESSVMLVITHLKSIVARCYTGSNHRSIEELDREEMKLEALENELTLHRLQAGDGVTAETLEREAVCNELEATVQLERAKELRRMARTNTRVLDFRRDFVRPMGVPQS